MTYLNKNLGKLQSILKKLGINFENIELIQISNNIVTNDNRNKQEKVVIPNKIISGTGIMENNTFENFLIDETNERAYMLIKKIDNNDMMSLTIPTITIVGKSGVGKTHLATALLNSFKMRNNGEYSYFFKKHFFQEIIKKGFEEGNIPDVLNHIINAKIVVFDDLVFIAELPNVYVKLIYDIIDSRNTKNLPTIFTTPIPPESIEIRDKKDLVSGSSPYFRIINEKVYFSEPFLSRLKANERYIELPSFNLKYSFFKKKLLINGIDILSYDREILEKIEYLLSSINADFRIINDYVNQFLDLYILYYDPSIVVDKLLELSGGKINTKLDQKKHSRINYIIFKLNDLLKVDLFEIFSKPKITNKNELNISILAVYILNKICGFKQTDIASVFNINRTSVNKKIKQFEEIKDDPSIMKMYSVIMNDNTIK